MKIGTLETTLPVQDRPVPPAGQAATVGLPGGETHPVDRNDLAAAVDILNQAVKPVDQGLRFRLHEDTKILQVEVVNRQTNEVIRTIPPDEILDLMARIHAMVGLFLDQRI